MSGVNVDVKAETNSTVRAPVLAGNTISDLNISNYNAAAKEKEREEQEITGGQAEKTPSENPGEREEASGSKRVCEDSHDLCTDSSGRHREDLYSTERI